MAAFARSHGAPGALAAGLLAFLLVPGSTRGERLAIERFTQADGLAGDRVQDLYQDRAGFLWIATASGLSRFDGRRFVTYDTRHGLPHPDVFRVLETSDGELWVATAGGLARLNPHARYDAARFDIWTFGSNPNNIVRTLFEDSGKRLWVAAGPNLLRARREGERTRFERVPLRPRLPGRLLKVNSVIEDPGADLWIGTDQGLIRILPDSRQTLHPIADSETTHERRDDPVAALGFDRARNLWLGVPNVGIYVFRPEAAAATGRPETPLALRAAHETPTPDCRVERAGDVCFYSAANPIPDTSASDIVIDDDRVWLATGAGLLRFDGRRFRAWNEAHGLVGTRLNTLLRDTDGNLWLGSVSRGLLRLAAGGMESYGEPEGLRPNDVAQLLHTARGEVVAVTLGSDGYGLNVVTRNRIESLRPRGLERGWHGWGFNQWVVQDSRGEWWIPTDADGLYRYPAVDRVEALAETSPRAHYTTADGLPSDRLWRLYEDGAGDLWLSLFGESPVVVWERSSGRFRPLGAESGLPGAGLAGTPTAFAEDADGRLWIGFYEGGVARSTDASRRRFQYFGEEVGVPATWVLDLFVDSTGRLWIAAGRAILRVESPAAPSPEFRRLTAADGITLETACCFAEDALGRVYVGGPRGVDRLDPMGGGSRHFTTADGLAGNVVRSMLTDGRGDLWFGTLDGLSRLRPRREPPSRPPPVRIANVEVAGVPWPVPELGATKLTGLTLRPNESRLTVEYIGIGLRPGEDLRYQYRLRGESEPWSAPLAERAVTFAALPAGAHTFEVRAVRDDGIVSRVPATLSFRRLPPVAERAWFRALVLAAIAFAIWSVARLRARRRAALARERRRIAEDLHDELGSGLARMSILSEVASRRVTSDPAKAQQVLQRIGEASRQMTDAAADLVWSLDAPGEELAGLISRLREYAGDVLSGAGIAWTLVTPPAAAGLRLGPRRQRQLLLILKEAIHNVVRHADARRVELGLTGGRGELHAWVRDDGCGFDPAVATDRKVPGLGLRSMDRRAGRLGGRLEVQATVGNGTTVHVRLPTAPRGGRMRMRPRRSGTGSRNAPQPSRHDRT